MSMMESRGAKVGLVLLAVLVVVVAVWFVAFRKPWKARHDVRELRRGLELYRGEQGEYPRGSVADICGLLIGQKIGGQNPRGLSYIDAKPYELNAAGEFVDPWGSVYRVATDGASPVVYSCGPNRHDDHGSGDDITE
jgi:type II secretory pathway pseudopilin PulG